MRDKIDTTNTLIHDCLLSSFGIGTSKYNVVVKLVLWAQTSPSNFNERVIPENDLFEFDISWFTTVH